MHLLLVISALLLTTTTCLAYRVNVEKWEIRYFPEAAPAGCIMGGNYVDGTRLSIVVSKNYQWGLGLSNQKWNLQKDGSTDVAVFVDQKFIVSGKAKHWDRTIAVLDFPNADAFRPLQTGHQLNLAVPGGNLSFTLPGTAKAMSALLDCVKTLQPGREPSAAAAATDYKMVPPAEAAVMLSNLFNSAGIQGGWRLDPPKPNQEWINFRLASGANGFFRAARGSGTRSADEHATHVIGRLSELCKGSFLSGKQSEPSTDGSVVRKVVTTCRGDSNKDRKST